MAEPYKVSHDKLVAGIGTSDKYHKDWKDIASKFGKMVTARGFDQKHQGVEDDIRKKVKGARSEASVLREGAAAPAIAVGADALAGTKRALALKTARHLYFHKSFGKQRVWILSLPGQLSDFPMAYAQETPALVDQVLDTTGERFSITERKDLSEACQTGLAWVHKAMIACDSPLSKRNRPLFHRWFVPSGMADEDARITEWATTLRTSLKVIASGLKSGEVLLTDNLVERNTGSSLEGSEAFVFTAGDLIAIYIENAFFTGQNTLTGKVNWARIIVHELTHSYFKTKDHSYSWQGLLPRDGDTFKKANDKIKTGNPGFAAVRTLTFEQCKENADSWAFFLADAGGALSASDRARALGGMLHEISGDAPTQGMQRRLDRRAA